MKEDKKPTRKHPEIMEGMLEREVYHVRAELLEPEWLEEIYQQ